MEAEAEVRTVLEADARIAYGLVFGSEARGTAHVHSDIDVAIGLRSGHRLDTLEMGDLIGRLESALGRRVDLTIIDEAPCGVAHRAFRDGRPLFERDRSRFVEHKTKAFLEYMDWQPIEAQLTQGILRRRKKAGR